MLVNAGKMPPNHEAETAPRSANSLEVFIVIRQHFLVPMRDHLDEKVVLVFEVAIDCTLDDLGAFGDFGYKSVLVAFSLKHDSSCLHNVGDPPRAGQAIDLSAGGKFAHRVARGLSLCRHFLK